MIDGVVIKKIDIFQDDRGWLAEFYRSDETNQEIAMGYVSETKPGVVRGPHEHLQQSDCFVFILGTFKLFLWDNRQGATRYRELQTVEVGGGNPCAVIIPPGVVHAYKCISDQSGLTINLPDKLYKGRGKKEEVDEVRWEAMTDSPFVIE